MYNYTYSPSAAKPRKRSKVILFVKLVILGLLIFGGWKIISAEPFSFSGEGDVQVQIEEPALPIDSVALEALLTPYLPKDFLMGIYLYDFETGSTYALNADKSFEAASLTKIPVLLTLFDEYEKGNIDLESTLTIKSHEWVNFGTSVLVYKGPGTRSTYTIQDFIYYMLNRSDNTSYEVLSNYFGGPKINSNLIAWGYIGSDILKNTTTPIDMVGMFDVIYNDKMASGELAKDVKEYLTETNEESRIPGLLPEGTVVIHKTGNGVGSLQDAGVIELEGRPYVLAILTKGIKETKSATEIIQKVSLEIFEYMRDL